MGLVLCLLLPFLSALSLHTLSARLLPFSAAACTRAVHGMVVLLFFHWRVGAILAQGIGAVFATTLAEPYDVLALTGAVLLLAFREQERHARYEGRMDVPVGGIRGVSCVCLTSCSPIYSNKPNDYLVLLLLITNPPQRPNNHKIQNQKTAASPCSPCSAAAFPSSSPVSAAGAVV